jgi:hypothetical protein
MCYIKLTSKIQENRMAVIIENIPEIPDWGSNGKRVSDDGIRSESARIVESLKALPKGHCITLLPETDQPRELARLRTHWVNAASRAKIKIVTRAVTTEAGDRAIRIWRVSKDQ